MIKQTPWLEITICGFIYVLGIIILILHFSNIVLPTDLKKLELKPITDNLFIISALLIISSYLAGLLVHKFICLCCCPIYYYIKKLLTGKSYSTTDKTTGDITDRDCVKIFQHASQNLHLEIAYQYNHLVVARLFTPGIIFLGGSIFIWLHNTSYKQNALFIALGCFLFGIIGLIIWIKQTKEFREFKNCAVQEINKTLLLKKLTKHQRKRLYKSPPLIWN